MSDIPMVEYLIWSNCNNNCAFCWQKKINDPTTILNEAEKITAIDTTIAEIGKLGYTDILVVGGELLMPHSEEVNSKLAYLFRFIAERIRNDETRYFYVNTNMLYQDRTNLDSLITIFKGLENRLKFTTSCDPYGRFRTQEAENTFVSNLTYMHEHHPEINIVMNMIMTYQFGVQYLAGRDDGGMCIDTMKQFGVKYVNLLPYIPVEDDRSMDVTEGQILTMLEKAEAESPGYFADYVRDYDLNQNKILYEYHKGEGYRGCTAEYMDCGHNKNFSKVLKSGECYICRIKHYLEDWEHRFEGRGQQVIENGNRKGSGAIIPLFDDDTEDGFVEDWKPFEISD